MAKIAGMKNPASSVDGIVLAAGYSSRTASNKMLLKFGDKTMIEKCIEEMSCVCSQIILVGGHKFDDIAQVLIENTKVKLIFNPNYHEGMFSSIKAGLLHVRGDRFFLTPGDYPLISSGVYKKMLQNDGEIVVPIYKGIKGHPVLIKSSLIIKILNNCEHNNLKDFINNRGFSTVDVEEYGILRDVDTMEDYIEICELFNNWVTC